MIYNLLSTYAIDLFEPIAKWLAIGVIALNLIVGIICFFAKKENFNKTLKFLLIELGIFLLVLGLTCLILEIIKTFSEGYAENNGLDKTLLLTHLLLPIAVLLILLLASAITTLIVSKQSSEEHRQSNVKKCLTISGIIDLIALVVAGVLMAIFFENYKDWYTTLNQPVLYISSILLVIVIIALAFILDKTDKPFDTRCIAMAGITIAMSFGLSFIRLWQMPQGGSVTLCSLLPIMIFSYFYGTKKGVFACFIYGVLQAIQDPWIVHPAQFLLDYPIAFAGIGLTGVFANFKPLKNAPQISFLLGGIIASIARFIAHLLSGVFAFPSTDINPWINSLAYNSFVFVDIAIVLAIGMIVFSSKTVMKELNK